MNKSQMLIFWIILNFLDPTCNKIVKFKFERFQVENTKIAQCKTVLKICSNHVQKSFIPQAHYMKQNLKIGCRRNTENNHWNRKELMFLCKKIGFKLLFLPHYMDFSSRSHFQLLYLQNDRGRHGVNTKRRGQLF